MASDVATFTTMTQNNGLDEKIDKQPQHENTHLPAAVDSHHHPHHHHFPNHEDTVAAAAEEPTILNDPIPHGKWYHVAFHVTTVMVGTGVLGLPRAMAQLTWIPGIILLVLSYAASYFTATILSRMHITKPDEEDPKPMRLKTYFAIGTYVLGKRRAKWCIIPFQYIILVGTSIAYLIAAGENISALYQEHCANCVAVHQYVWTTIVMVVQLFLCFFPSLESVSFISMLAAGCSMCYCIISVTLCFYVGQQPDAIYGMGDNNTTENVFNFFTGISTMAFAFGPHMIIPEIQATLAPNPCPKRANIKGITVTWAFVLVLYFCSAVSGYWAFGQNVQGNVLMSIEAIAGDSKGVSAALTIAQVLVVVHVVIAFQVLSQPVYAAMERQMTRRVSMFANAKSKALARTPLRFTYILVTWFVAIAIPFFGDIMSLFGALGITPLTFVMPCVMYMVYMRGELALGTQAVCMTVAAVGVIVGVAGSVASVRQIVVDAGQYKLFE